MADSNTPEISSVYAQLPDGDKEAINAMIYNIIAHSAQRGATTDATTEDRNNYLAMQAWMNKQATTDAASQDATRYVEDEIRRNREVSAMEPGQLAALRAIYNNVRQNNPDMVPDFYTKATDALINIDGIQVPSIELPAPQIPGKPREQGDNTLPKI